MISSDDAPALEASLHRRFVERQMNTLNKRKEFFRVSLLELRQIVQELGIDASWTLAAEASQFKETLALEQAMKTDTDLKKRWIEEQARFDFDDEAPTKSSQNWKRSRQQLGVEIRVGKLLAGLQPQASRWHLVGFPAASKLSVAYSSTVPLIAMQRTSRVPPS
jgi:hypothetical protein